MVVGAGRTTRGGPVSRLRRRMGSSRAVCDPVARIVVGFFYLLSFFKWTCHVSLSRPPLSSSFPPSLLTIKRRPLILLASSIDLIPHSHSIREWVMLFQLFSPPFFRNVSRRRRRCNLCFFFSKSLSYISKPSRPPPPPLRSLTSSLPMDCTTKQPLLLSSTSTISGFGSSYSVAASTLLPLSSLPVHHIILSLPPPNVKRRSDWCIFTSNLWIRFPSVLLFFLLSVNLYLCP